MISAIRVSKTLIVGLLGLFAAPLVFAQGFFPADPNQRGLSGAWSDPARPDQKIFIDIAPDANGPGKGRLLGGWLTFGTADANGPETQRWYTLQGDVSSGQPDTQLTLHRSSGGRFDAPAQVKTETIGQAVLRFDDCYSGSLRYVIKAPGDSVERKGTLALRRKNPSLTCLNPMGGTGPGAPAAALSGSWYQAATNGQGFLLDLDQRNGSLSGAWLTHANDAVGSPGPRWFSVQAPLGFDVAHLSDLPIYTTSDGQFDAGNRGTTLRVGTAQLIFTGCDSAQLDYRFDAGENAGLHGQIALARLLAQPCDASALSLATAVEAPSGIHAAELVVVGAAQEISVADDGTAVLPRASGAPSLVSAVHANGKAVLLGMADPLAPSLRLNARSSAVALLFFALGGTQAPEENRRRLIELIDKNAPTTDVEKIIAARLATDPFAIERLDDGIVSAVLSAAKILRGSTSIGLSAARAAASPATPKAAAAANAAIEPLLLITPSDAPNGIGVIADGRSSNFKIQNDKRRPALARLYERAYRPAAGDGAEIELAPPQQIGAVIAVPSTQALSIFSALGDIFEFNGRSPWQPVQTDSVSLQQHAEADKTRFDLVVLAPVWDAPTPAFFNDSKYAQASAQWRDDLKQMYAQTAFNIAFGALLEALGVGGGTVSEATFARLIAGASASTDAGVAAIWAQAASGVSLRQVCQFMVYQFSGSLDPAAFGAQTAAQREMMVDLVAETNPALSAQIKAGRLSQARFANMRVAVRALAAVYLVGAVADTGAQWKDLHTGDSANLFDVTLWQPDVKISPNAAKIAAGGTQSFVAKVPGNDDADLSYRWSLEGDNLAILSGGGNNGRAFETASARVDLVTTPSSQGQYLITVEVFGRVGSAKQSLGRATATVTLDGVTVSLSPESALIERQNGRATFTVGFNPAQDTSNFEYEWTTASRAGALTCAGQTTSTVQPTVVCASGTATYNGKSDNLGGEIEDVHVTVYRHVVDELGNAQRVRVGAAKSYVQLKQMFSIRLTPDNAEVLPNGSLTLQATFAETLPPGSSVTWHWSMSGPGSLVPTPTSSIPAAATYTAGSGIGDAYVSVYAYVDVGGSDLHNLYILPQTNHVKITLNPQTIPIRFQAFKLSGACNPSYPYMVCATAFGGILFPKLPAGQRVQITCKAPGFSQQSFFHVSEPGKNPWTGAEMIWVVNGRNGGITAISPYSPFGLGVWDNGSEYLALLTARSTEYNPGFGFYPYASLDDATNAYYDGVVAFGNGLECTGKTAP